MDLRIAGSSVKDLGSGRIGGFGVLFGGPDKTDLAADYFTAETDFDWPATGTKECPVYYNHGFDDIIGTRVIGRATLSLEPAGVWIEAQLNLRDEYERAIYAMAKSGKLGWSSGTASHLVEREVKGASAWIKRWPLGLDMSLTPRPAEPRTLAVPIKSAAEYRAALFSSLKAAGAADSEEALGDMTEPAMAGAAFRALADALSLQVWELLYGAAGQGEEQTPAEKKTQLEGLVAAFGEMALRVIGAMLDAHPEPDGDEAKTLRNAWLASPDTLASIKSGRQVSTANLSKLTKLHQGMRGAVASMQGHMDTMQSMLADMQPAGGTDMQPAGGEVGDEDAAAAKALLRRRLIESQIEVNAIIAGDLK
jgi:hypothetical protein